jgi:hypothetical protein
VVCAVTWRKRRGQEDTISAWFFGTPSVNQAPNLPLTVLKRGSGLAIPVAPPGNGQIAQNTKPTSGLCNGPRTAV